jgi:hypothetical protein
MLKLKLEIDALRVESFETHPAAYARGTVEGRVIAQGEVIGTVVPVTNDVKQCLDSWINTCVTAKISDCPGETCGDKLTCGASCQATCETCYGPTCVTACLGTCLSGGPVCCA